MVMALAERRKWAETKLQRHHNAVLAREHCQRLRGFSMEVSTGKSMTGFEPGTGLSEGYSQPTRKSPCLVCLHFAGQEAKGCGNQRQMWRGFSGGTVVKNPPANAGDTGSSTSPGRSLMLRSD